MFKRWRLFVIRRAEEWLCEEPDYREPMPRGPGTVTTRRLGQESMGGH